MSNNKLLELADAIENDNTGFWTKESIAAAIRLYADGYVIETIPVFQEVVRPKEICYLEYT